MKIKKSDLALIALAAIWITSLAWFSLSAAGCPRRLKTQSNINQRKNEFWYGIYLKNRKIGYSVTSSQTLPDGRRWIANRSRMRLSMMDQSQEVASSLSYELDANYNLKRFEFKLGGAADIQVSGEVAGKKLTYTVMTSNSPQKQQADLAGPITLPDALEPMLAGRKLKPGQRFNFSTFDPASLAIQPSTVIVVGPESLLIAGTNHPAVKLRLEISGLTSTAWIDSSGNLLRQDGPLGISLIAEERTMALNMPASEKPLDILGALSVPAIGPEIQNPRNLIRLKIRLSQIDEKIFDLSCCRQNLDGSVVEIKVEESPRKGHTPYPESLSVWLEPTPLIQSKDPAISSIADSIAGNQLDNWQKICRLSQWVYNSLIKTMTASLPSALEVLSSRRGDCNEHATFFCALARSQKIPCRLCLGLVYMDGQFYYHAWNQVWCGHWIEVDPTFGQCPADAARLRLVLGDLTSQTRLLPAMGNLKIEILDFK